MAITFGKLEHIDPRELWTSEAANFTPWLADRLQLLGEALGFDLELVQIEQPVGDFACDIEARETGTNRHVIIENQLEATDHRHLGQLLTYAGGLDAAIVVWISPEIRDEHRQALDWLNRHTDDQIDFFGVALEPIRIDSSNPAVQFRPVAFPNKWRRGDLGRQAPISNRYLAYRSFFQLLLDQLREVHNYTNARIAQPQSWYSFSSGIANISYGASFAAGNRLRAEVYISAEDINRNKAIFDWLFQRKADIEAQMGEDLVWERLDHRRASRISAVRQNTTIADAAEHGDELRAWLIDHLLRLKSVFAPLLREAFAATASVATLEPSAAEE
jgi:hypothetical protein